MSDKKNSTGDRNTGNKNTGDRNTGNKNTGDRNTGYGNTGDGNTGDGNTGYGNTGDGNTGDRNTGYWNTGDRNTGNKNTGNKNTGDKNTGDRNTGYGNNTNRSSGIFCSVEPSVISFNKPTDKKWSEIEHPDFSDFYLTKWIRDSEMSDQEKVDHPTFLTTTGYLREYSWDEAWANFWRDTSEENRQRVLALPNFDAEVFKEITGIDVVVEPKPEELSQKVLRLVEKADFGCQQSAMKEIVSGLVELIESQGNKRE